MQLVYSVNQPLYISGISVAHCHGIVQCTPTLTYIQDLLHPNSQQWLLLQFIVFLMMDAKGRPKHVEHTCSC